MMLMRLEREYYKRKWEISVQVGIERAAKSDADQMEMLKMNNHMLKRKVEQVEREKEEEVKRVRTLRDAIQVMKRLDSQED